jgi:protein TonB
MLATANGTILVVTDRDLGARFSASPAERLIRSPTPLSEAATSRWLPLLSAAFLHASILLLLIFGRELGPAIAPEAREIPVEIVIEPPPPKPDAPPAKAEPTPPARQIDEEIAFDAPRTPNKEKIERDAPDQATKAPGAPTATTAPSLSPAPAQVASAEQSAPGAAQKSAEPVLDSPAAEEKRTLDVDREEPDPQQAAVDAKAPLGKLPALVGQPFPTWSTGAPLVTSDYLPGIELGSAAGPAPVTGGKAKTTYLSILYGMVIAHLHAPADIREGPPKARGAIVFTVDGTGNLVQRQIAQASGSRELDSAALGAIAEAAPFPPPPLGMPMRLKFTYGAK